MATQVLEDGEQLSDYRVHIYSNPYFFGYPIKREDLTVQYARVYDPRTRNFVGPSMRWVGEPEEKPFNVVIKAGQDSQVQLFGVYKSRIHHYSGDKLHNIYLADNFIEIGTSKKLEIHISDMLGRVYKIPFSISAIEKRNNMHKVNFDVRFKSTMSDRFRQIGNGFRQIWNAFFGPSY